MATAWIIFSIILGIIWIGFGIWYVYLTLNEEWADDEEQKYASITMLIGLFFVFFHIIGLIMLIPAFVVYLFFKAFKKVENA